MCLSLTPSSLSPIQGLQPLLLSTVGTWAYWSFDVYTLDVALLRTWALISLLFVTRHTILIRCLIFVCLPREAPSPRGGLKKRGKKKEKNTKLERKILLSFTSLCAFLAFCNGVCNHSVRLKIKKGPVVQWPQILRGFLKSSDSIGIPHQGSTLESWNSHKAALFEIGSPRESHLFQDFTEISSQLLLQACVSELSAFSLNKTPLLNFSLFLGLCQKSVAGNEGLFAKPPFEAPLSPPLRGTGMLGKPL